MSLIDLVTLEISLHEPVYPLWVFGVGRAIKGRQVGLEVQDRCAVYGIQSLHSQDVSVNLNQPDRCYPNWVGPVLGSLGKDADFWHIGSLLWPPDKVTRHSECGLVHEEEDDHMGKLIEALKPRRKRVQQMDFSDHISPVFVHALFHGRLDDSNRF